MSDTLERPQLKGLKKYIPGKSIEQVQRELGLPEVIKLASNENPLGPSPKAIAAMHAELDKLNLYPEPTCPDLTVEMAAYLGVGEDNLLFTNGGDGMLTVIAQAFVNHDDEAVMGLESFSIYSQVVTVMGGKPVFVPLDKDFRHDLKAMAAAITPKTKLIFVCCPNNPTGTINSKAEMDWFLDQVPSSAVVVLDQAYYDYVESPDYPRGIDYVKEGRNVILLRTFSKIAGLAGVRIGFVIAKASLIDSLAKVRESFPVNRLAQAGARGFIKDDEFKQKTLSCNHDGKLFLYAELKRLGLQYVPTDANFIFVNFGVDSKEAFIRLQRKGVIVRPGYIWDLPTWTRVTIGTEYDNQKFIEALTEVLEDMKAS
jgi:histidinol-phosphate aminotransferase